MNIRENRLKVIDGNGGQHADARQTLQLQITAIRDLAVLPQYQNCV